MSGREGGLGPVFWSFVSRKDCISRNATSEFKGQKLSRQPYRSLFLFVLFPLRRSVVPDGERKASLRNPFLVFFSNLFSCLKNPSD